MTDKNFNVARIVLAGCLAGWFIKAVFFIPYLTSSVFRVPVTFGFFPAFFQNNYVSLIAYLAPLIGFVAVFKLSRRLMKAAAFVQWICAVILLLHVNTYNDATFVVEFWVSLWLGWFLYQACVRPEGLDRKALMLAGWIVAVIFMGGFAGKLTPEYTSGEVIHRIFSIQDPSISPMGWILKQYNASVQIILCAWIAKGILLGEGFLALSGFIGIQRITWPALIILAVIPFFSTWAILSVLSPLIGLIIAARCLDNRGPVAI